LSIAAKRANSTNRAALEDGVDVTPQALEYCFNWILNERPLRTANEEAGRDQCRSRRRLTLFAPPLPIAQAL
jgi:hypothetical protein